MELQGQKNFNKMKKVHLKVNISEIIWFVLSFRASGRGRVRKSQEEAAGSRVQQMSDFPNFPGVWLPAESQRNHSDPLLRTNPHVCFLR